MTESTLSIQLSSLRKEVGEFLGHGRDSSKWESGDKEKIDACIKSGLRRFYMPSMNRGVDGWRAEHQWSFLKPITSLVTESGTKSYDLPDLYAGIIGNLTHAADETYQDIRITSESRIRSMRASDDSQGIPHLAAVRPKSTTNASSETVFDASGGQRFELVLYRTPDAAYTFEYQFRINPDALTSSAPYPLGGAAHAETILEGCLAVAEERYNKEKGIHNQNFIERLIASLDHDKRSSTPDVLGYNGDRSNGEFGPGEKITYVRFNGVLYDNT